MRLRRLERGNRDVLPARVPERHIAEFDATLRRDEFEGSRTLGDRHRGIEHFEHSLEADERGEHLESGIRESGERLVDALDECCHRHECADGDATVDDHECTDAIDRHRTQRTNETERNEEHSSIHRRLDPDVTHP